MLLKIFIKNFYYFNIVIIHLLIYLINNIILIKLLQRIILYVNYVT